MKLRDVLKSPVFGPGHRWSFRKRTNAYESDVTALVRAMLEDERIKEDQRFAFERWRRRDWPRQAPSTDGSNGL
jgi:hypothetical protein